MKCVLRRNPAPVLIFIILIVAASGTLAADDPLDKFNQTPMHHEGFSTIANRDYYAMNETDDDATRRST